VLQRKSFIRQRDGRQYCVKCDRIPANRVTPWHTNCNDNVTISIHLSMCLQAVAYLSVHSHVNCLKQCSLTALNSIVFLVVNYSEHLDLAVACA